jgi:glycosyltransferase involved in cell wall biosynthesis
LLAAEPFDLVHAHLYASQAACAAALATCRPRVPLVVTDHTEGPWRGWAARAISRRTYARGEHLMAVSTAIRDRLIADYAVAPGRVTYVPNAVVSPPAGDEHDLWSPDRLTVGRVARLQPEKGFDVFLHAVAELAPHSPGVDFVVIGDGPLREDLAALARRLGVAERVRFLGLRHDARALIARLDVLAVSSITDGAPLVVLEAMAAGVPVVASAVGGIPDQVVEGETGLLVEPGDPSALAAALATVLRDESLRRRLGANGRGRAEREFGYEAFVARIEAVYASAVAAPPARAIVPAPVPAGAPRAS